MGESGHYRSPEVLLSASGQECILYRLRVICARQAPCCMKLGSNVHDQSHSARDKACVGREGTQSALCLEIRCIVFSRVFVCVCVCGVCCQCCVRGWCHFAVL